MFAFLAVSICNRACIWKLVKLSVRARVTGLRMGETGEKTMTYYAALNVAFGPAPWNAALSNRGNSLDAATRAKSLVLELRLI